MPVWLLVGVLVGGWSTAVSQQIPIAQNTGGHFIDPVGEWVETSKEGDVMKEEAAYKHVPYILYDQSILSEEGGHPLESMGMEEQSSNKSEVGEGEADTTQALDELEQENINDEESEPEPEPVGQLLSLDEYSKLQIVYDEESEPEPKPDMTITDKPLSSFDELPKLYQIFYDEKYEPKPELDLSQIDHQLLSYDESSNPEIIYVEEAEAEPDTLQMDEHLLSIKDISNENYMNPETPDEGMEELNSPPQSLDEGIIESKRTAGKLFAGVAGLAAGAYLANKVNRPSYNYRPTYGYNSGPAYGYNPRPAYGVHPGYNSRPSYGYGPKRRPYGGRPGYQSYYGRLNPEDMNHSLQPLGEGIIESKQTAGKIFAGVAGLAAGAYLANKVNRPSYNNRPNYGARPGYNSRPSYGYNSRPAYGYNPRPAYGVPPGYNSRPSYGYGPKRRPYGGRPYNYYGRMNNEDMISPFALDSIQKNQIQVQDSARMAHSYPMGWVWV